MTSGIYSQEFEAICTVCFLPDCIEFEAAPRRNICPLRIVKRLNLTANQGIQLSQVAQVRRYEPGHFLRMAEITAERNQLSS